MSFPDADATCLPGSSYAVIARRHPFVARPAQVPHEQGRVRDVRCSRRSHPHRSSAVPSRRVLRDYSTQSGRSLVPACVSERRLEAAGTLARDERPADRGHRLVESASILEISRIACGAGSRRSARVTLPGIYGQPTSDNLGLPLYLLERSQKGRDRLRPLQHELTLEDEGGYCPDAEIQRRGELGFELLDPVVGFEVGTRPSGINPRFTCELHELRHTGDVAAGYEMCLEQLPRQLRLGGRAELAQSEPQEAMSIPRVRGDRAGPVRFDASDHVGVDLDLHGALRRRTAPGHSAPAIGIRTSASIR